MNEWDEGFINKGINDLSRSAAFKSMLSKLEALMPKSTLIVEITNTMAAQGEWPRQINLDTTNKIKLFCSASISTHTFSRLFRRV